MGDPVRALAALEAEARDERTTLASRGTLETMFDQIGRGESKELAIVIKADAQGSIEAIQNSAQQLANDEVSVRVLHTGVGAINESDVALAKAVRRLQPSEEAV